MPSDDLLAPARRGMFRLKEILLRRGTYRFLAQIERDAHHGPAERRARQWQALRQVVIDAARVPHYRKRWRGLDLDAAMASPASYAEQVPILTRERLRQAGRELVSEVGGGRIIRSSTSGSSGQLTEFYSDTIRAGASAAARLYARRRLGLREGLRESRLMGRAWVQTLGWRDRLACHLGWWGSRLSGTIKVDAFSGGDADLADQCAEIARFRPTILSGYGGSMLTLADYVLRSGRQADMSSVRAAIFASEPIYASGRALLSRAFGVTVTADYVCHEMGMIAHECPAGNLHLNDDFCYAETVDDDGHPVFGEPGHLVLTDLVPSRTPYIRYALGDMAELDDPDAVCSCGAPQRMLKQFVGRQDDRIRRPDGSYLHPFSIDYLLIHLAQVSHWQTRLTPPNRLCLLIEIAPEALAPTYEMMLAQLKRYVGSGFVCSLEAVDRIAPEPTGKYARIVREAGWPVDAVDEEVRHDT